MIGRPEPGRHVERFGHALIEPLPDQAVLLVRGELPSNAARYARHGLGAREDVTVLDQELLTRPWYARRVAAHTGVELPARPLPPGGNDGFDLVWLVEANPGRRFFVFPGVKPGDESWRARFALVPEGLASELVERERASRWSPPSSGLGPLDEIDWPAQDAFGPKAWEHELRRELLAALHRRDLFSLQLPLARAKEPALLDDARRALDEARRRAGDEVP